MNNEMLIDLCSKTKSLTISVGDFTDLLKEPTLIFNWISDKDILKTALYATYNDTKIFVSRDLAYGQYKLSEE